MSETEFPAKLLQAGRETAADLRHIRRSLPAAIQNMPDAVRCLGIPLGVLQSADSLLRKRSRLYLREMTKYVQRSLPDTMPPESFLSGLRRLRPELAGRKLVWVCWWQGEEKAPEMVRYCLASLRRHMPEDAELHLITEKNCASYIELDPVFTEKAAKGIITSVHLTDILRMQLLYLYGGLWADATCYFTDGSCFEQAWDTEFFSPCTMAGRERIHETSHGKWFSFLMGGRPGNAVCAYGLYALRRYWENRENMPDYVLIDYVIAAGYKALPEVRRAIDTKPAVRCDHIWDLLRCMYYAAEEEDYQRLVESEGVFKLSYRLEFPFYKGGKPTAYFWFLQDQGSTGADRTAADPGNCGTNVQAEAAVSENAELLTVIVPVYNAELYLERCLNSILSQTWKNLEILLTDDGSEDGSVRICRKFADKDTRIRLIETTHGGQGRARNLALEQMRGEYVLFVDADDFIHPQMAERLLAGARQSGAEIVQCGYAETAEDGTVLRRWHALEKRGYIPPRMKQALEPDLTCFTKCPVVQTEEKTEDAILIQGVPDVVCWNKLCSRRIAELCRFPEGICYEDRMFTLQQRYYTRTVAYIDETLYFYVQTSGSTMRREPDAYRLRSSLAVMQQISDFCREKNLPENYKKERADQYWECLALVRDTYRKPEFREYYLQGLEYMKGIVHEWDSDHFSRKLHRLIVRCMKINFRLTLEVYLAEERLAEKWKK